MSRTVFTAISLLTFASGAHGQPALSSGWGVNVSTVPSWRVPSGDSVLGKLGEVALSEGDLGLSVEGSDFRIGVVRGKPLGGEWGVSFVRRQFEDGSTQGAILENCFEGFQGTQCNRFGTVYTYQNVTLTGVEANKFIPFGTIKQRLQIGIDLAGGIGAMKGSAEKRSVIFEGEEVTEDVTETEARELLAFDPAVFGRFELGAAVILPRGLKLRVSGGMNFPGVHTASLSVMYFFGRQ